MQNPFAETGGASSFVTLWKDYGCPPHGADSQLTLTPFQRQVVEAEENRRAEAQQAEMDEQQGQQGQQRRQNSRASPASAGNDAGYAETVRYINRAENPDFKD